MQNHFSRNDYKSSTSLKNTQVILADTINVQTNTGNQDFLDDSLSQSFDYTIALIEFNCLHHELHLHHIRPGLNYRRLW